MSEAYAKRYRCCALRCEGNGPGSSEGVYGRFPDPATRPGGDPLFAGYRRRLVGMSTIPETIAANHMDERPRISCVTNAAAGVLDQN